MPHSANVYESLADLIVQKHRCLKRVHELGQRQMGCVTSGDIEGLLEILAVKQRVLGDLQTIDHRLKEIGAYGDEVDAIPQEWREAIAGVLIESRALLEEILRTESECAHILEQRKQDIAKQLAELHDFVRARTAYQQPGDESGQLDLTL
ncbi:MAG: flagellar export chaperone FlgN [Thermogutta sp.]|nr:flagellar export chaperone FlgN [Thermogutta sp.]HOP76906.1 flagellar export chaperone FlgN [Thermogutta sp.]HPU05466.1 flagellar export chaperone FlgN [Thermogutta sp.]HPZ82518.1 flagellar export chaperone FlgN [Thermogutta sp.]HQF12268.1 flagellar export chaperone FlgN [Thermogutta sp.]